MRTIEGLLHTNFIPSMSDLREDISIMGIRLSKLVYYRPFNIHFSIEHLNSRALCDLLHNEDHKDISEDLIVPKPHVLDITNQRLGIHFPIRNPGTEFADILIEDEPQNDMTTQSEDGSNLILDLMSVEDLSVLGSIVDQSTQSNFHDIWIDPTADLNLIRTMTKQRITYQPKKILEKVLHVKYHILTKLVTNINMLNKKTINAANSILNNVYITYSLIYAYDTQFANTETPSPDGCELVIDPFFDHQYQVNVESDLSNL